MQTESGEIVEVLEEGNGRARIRVKEPRFSKASAWVTADELAAFARECLAIAESMREMASVEKEIEASEVPRGEEISDEEITSAYEKTDGQGDEKAREENTAQSKQGTE